MGGRCGYFSRVWSSRRRAWWVGERDGRVSDGGVKRMVSGEEEGRSGCFAVRRSGMPRRLAQSRRHCM